jgi:hypothetical protein
MTSLIRSHRSVGRYDPVEPDLKRLSICLQHLSSSSFGVVTYVQTDNASPFAPLPLRSFFTTMSWSELSQVFGISASGLSPLVPFPLSSLS